MITATSIVKRAQVEKANTWGSQKWSLRKVHLIGLVSS